MPRYKGQKGATWPSAEDLPPSSLKNYLCELGPRYCPICVSPCAYGRRYMEIQKNDKRRIIPHGQNQPA